MINTASQQDIIEGCKKGDLKAQLQIYKSNYKQMFNISYSLVGNATDAHEIVRESFMIVFGKAGAFRGLADFNSWLRGLVEDKSVETWRKNNVPSPGLVPDKSLVE